MATVGRTMKGLDMEDRTSQAGTLIIFGGWPGSGKSHIIKRIYAEKEDDFPIPLGPSPHVSWKKLGNRNSLPEWTDKLARGRNLLFHFAIGQKTRNRDDADRQAVPNDLRQAIQVARQVNLVLVVAEPEVVRRRLDERRHMRTPGSDYGNLTPADLAGGCDALLESMSEIPGVRTIIVDSSRPHLDYYDLSDWLEVRKKVLGV